jgi:hypothetical protein
MNIITGKQLLRSLSARGWRDMNDFKMLINMSQLFVFFSI